MNLILAALLITTSKGVVVADHHRVELHDRGAIVWKAEGPANPTRLVATDREVTVIDALNNEARTFALATGNADPAIAEHGVFRKDGLTYVRNTGELRIRDKRVAMKPFAADLETDGRTAYLVYPREAKIRTIDLRTLETGEFTAGVVPVDLAINGRFLAIADPSAKRVWMIEGVQSMTEAVARGFLRGLLGLGIGKKNSDFPTGVDRVECRSGKCVAFDSMTRTLYDLKGKVLAKNAAFAIGDDAVYLYADGKLTALRLH